MPSSSMRPFDDQDLLRASYIDYLTTWLESRAWKPSMLSGKVGPDMEAQQAWEGRRRPVEMAMRLVYHVHAHMLQSGRAATHSLRGTLSRSIEMSAWREVLDQANPWLLTKRPQLREMRHSRAARAVDFLAEFDSFVAEEGLTERQVVVMDCPWVETWAEQILD
ncbi:hypothetical protein JDV02_008726 [Purpureocillium takamizusanense]|uniref:Uncharacterized protein n=1 Tax=Purpureocillium takamizusanense TaxID=2060973 RepID=A0A9Q8VDK8_9HYPO|nr:uncharacterized protein JDV02_008726 [Purpureocillium takamizusanense]UNI22880.1 hypothetical protein JDV02_008726 [Purpureocillium takamizusanense]